MSDEPEVVTGNVIQVRIQAVDYPQRGIFKVVPESKVNEYFDDDLWQGIYETQTTVCGKAFQIITHHRVMTSGLVEAWWVTVTPVF